MEPDQVVITTPIYNLSLPAALKAWIDQVVRVGRTFARHDGGFKGLASVKRAIVIVASGSDFRSGSPGKSYNFIEPYLRAVLGFIGVQQVEFVYAHSLADPGSAEASRAVAETTLDEFARTIAA